MTCEHKGYAAYPSACPWCEIDNLRAQLAVLATKTAPEGWLRVKDTLPELNQHVALMCIDRIQNTGDNEMNLPVAQCGYMSEHSGKYWSVYGERALNISAFTHWFPLPSPPSE